MLNGAGGQTIIQVGDGSTAGGDNVNIASPLIGASGLVKTDLGTLILTGTNTYAGNTTISGGTLQIGAGGTTGSIIGDVVDNAALIFNRSDELTFGGAISGTGSLTQAGSGVVALTGTNTYTGATLINGGTLLGGAANVFSQRSATLINAGGVLDLGSFAQNIDTVQLAGGVLQNGMLTSAGGVSSTGGVINGLGGSTAVTTSSGTTTLTGVNTYTGVTLIDGGTLMVNGSSSGSAVNVNGSGTLSGDGTVASVTLQAGGTLSPGTVAAIGTLNATGPVTFLPGSVYDVRVTPTTNDRTVVAGMTRIAGGTVNVLAGFGAYMPQTRYNILTSAGGVTGTFADVTSNFAFLTPTLAYDANDVTLVLRRNDLSFAAVAATQNQRAVANALTRASSIATSAATGSVLNAVATLSAAQAQAAFDSLSGEGITAVQNVAHRSSELFAAAIFDQTSFYGSDRGGNSTTLTAPQPGFVSLASRQYTDGRPGPNGSMPLHELADLPSTRAAPVPPAFGPIRTWRAWGSGFGGEDNIHSNGVLGTAAQNDTIYGGTVGVDYQLTPNYLAGIAVGGSDGEFSVPNRATSGSTTGGHIAFYDLATFGGGFYGASTTSASFYQNRTTRNVGGFGGLASETEKGSFFSDEFRSRLEVGRKMVGAFGLGSVGSVTPFLALEIAELRSNGFGEQAIGGPGVFALNVSGQSTADVPAFVGARFQRVTALGNGMVFSPTLQLAYVHEFAPYRTQLATIASLPGSTFLVDGARPSRNAAQVKVGGELAIGPSSTIFANFDGEFSGGEQLYAGKGGFKYAF